MEVGHAYGLQIRSVRGAHPDNARYRFRGFDRWGTELRALVSSSNAQQPRSLQSDEPPHAGLLGAADAAEPVPVASGFCQRANALLAGHVPPVRRMRPE